MSAERQVPGGPYVNETATQQRQLPGWQYINETAAAGGGTAITPDKADLTLTGYAPSVARTEHHDISPGKADLTITGYAPTVESGAGISITPDAAALTLTGYAPTVTRSEHITVNPETGALIITSYAPTVDNPTSVSITPDAATLVLEGFAPSVVNSGDAVVSTGPVPAGGGRRRRRWQVEHKDELYEFDSPQEAFLWLQSQEREELKPAKPKRGRPRTRLVRTPQAVFYDGVEVTNLKVGRLTLAEAFQPSTDWVKVRKAIEEYFDDEAAAIAVVLH